jgi:hypothetical protein
MIRQRGSRFPEKIVGRCNATEAPETKAQTAAGDGVPVTFR